MPSRFSRPILTVYFLHNMREDWVIWIKTSISDNTTKRKGKPVEKRGRKATGLKLKSQDSRAAEYR